MVGIAALGLTSATVAVSVTGWPMTGVDVVTLSDESRTEYLGIFTAQDRVDAFLDVFGATLEAQGPFVVRILTAVNVFESVLNGFLGKLLINPDARGASFSIDLGSRLSGGIGGSAVDSPSP